MAKKQAFGVEAAALKASHRRMAKVIISTKVGRGKFGYREAMVSQDDVTEYIQKKKA